MTEEVAYESAEAERKRHDAEIAAENRARQIRLGHIPNPEETEEAPKPKAKSRAKKAESEPETE